MAQVVEHLPSKHQVLSSNPVLQKKPNKPKTHKYAFTICPAIALLFFFQY
jgi:hypothetical protein